MGYSKKKRRVTDNDLQSVAEELSDLREATNDLYDALIRASEAIERTSGLLEDYLLPTSFPEPVYFNGPPPPHYELSSNGLAAYCVRTETDDDVPF